MNYEAWQAQQKAARDEERRKKSQATEALRNYKGDGGNAEATKLAQLKEQDRLRKLEAEKQLRGYRGTLSEEDTKLMAYKEEERRKKQEAAALLRGYQGALSEEEAKLAAAREEERRKKQDAQKILHQSFENTDDEQEGGAETYILNGSVSTMKELFNGQAPKPMDSYSTSHDGTASEILGPECIAPREPPKMMAKFMFGLIGTGEYSSIDAYLEIIDQLVRRVIGEETRALMRFENPTVLYIKVDAHFTAPAGRENVVRKLITIGIPLTPPDRASGLDIELRIIEAARDTIASGGFKKH